METPNNRRPLLFGCRRSRFQYQGQVFLNARGKFRTALAELGALFLNFAGGNTQPGKDFSAVLDPTVSDLYEICEVSQVGRG